MNKCTVIQMIYLAILLMKNLKKQADIGVLKQFYSMTMSQLLDNDDYKGSALSNFAQAFEEMLESIVDLADNEATKEVERDLRINNLLDEEETKEQKSPKEQSEKKQANLLNSCPTDIKEPNFSRWGTVSAVAKIFKVSARIVISIQFQ